MHNSEILAHTLLFFNVFSNHLQLLSAIPFGTSFTSEFERAIQLMSMMFMYADQQHHHNNNNKKVSTHPSECKQISPHLTRRSEQFFDLSFFLLLSFFIRFTFSL